jgi:hypothetical protein
VIVLIFVTCLLGPVLTRLIGKRLQQREEATQPPD